MRLLPILALTTSALGDAAAARETVQDAALSARKLLHKESILTISSIFDPTVNPTLAGQPFAYPPSSSLNPLATFNSRLTEYYADCSSDGNPTLLLMNLEITTRNMNHGSPLAISIETTPPKGIYSVASLPRMNMNGRMEKLTSKKEVSLPKGWGVNGVGGRCVEVLFGETS